MKIAFAKRAPARSSPGQAVVELAVSISLLLVLALGTLDFGRVMYSYIAITNAAREGARYATLKAPLCDGDDIKNHMVAVVREQSIPPLIPALTTAMIQTSCADTACLHTGETLAQADRRTVCINYPFTPATPLVAQWWGDGTKFPLSTWATMPVMSQ